MKSSRNWKDRFRDAMFESVELQKHKIHRDLLHFLIHKANAKSRSCWVSRREMARVQGCSVRNIKDIIKELRDIGALMQVRFSELPMKDQEDINAISPWPMKGTASVYFICVGWAEEILAGERSENPRPGKIGISPTDRRKGTVTANDRRRRYGPPADISDIDISTTPEHDDWLSLNAIGEKGDVPTTPIEIQKGDVPTTDISIEYNQAANSTPNNDRAASIELPSSKAEPAEASQSPRQVQHPHTPRPGCGDGEASAPVPRAVPLARPEGTEYDAAGARANERRAS
ncbi:hypothetical protein ATY75_03265 [Rhizobium sp. N122]|uniref:helix-turn-helix domain-containing protein n=1 Tax=Rhizobium sp. N122 TaxID=1764272 RepID=UPI000B5A3C7C|nr:helix-turn-helix domain-containing protein [Rhizobium sp. N122]OWV87343.1 hypothetical protein ATY75_03265 [Rhizobium sp. N122]